MSIVLFSSSTCAFRVLVGHYVALFVDDYPAESLLESTASVDAEPEKVKEKVKESNVFAIQTRAIVFVRTGRHDDAVALLDAWGKDLRDPEPRFIECLARFPSDPARATKLFERAKKEWSPSTRDMYELLLLHDAVQELVRRHAADAPKP